MAQLGLDGFQALGGGIEFILERGNLGLGGFGGLFLALAHELADLFGELIALGLQSFSAHLQGFALGFQGTESLNASSRVGDFTGGQDGR